MVSEFFVNPKVIARLQAGPLGPHVGGFAEAMKVAGHPSSVVRIYIRTVARLSRWMKRRRLEVLDLCEARVEEFLRPIERKRAGVAETVTGFVGHLRRGGIVGPPTLKRLLTPSEVVQQDFAQYLKQARGLADSTMVNYLWHVRRFLAEQYGNGPARLDGLDANKITGFVLRHARGGSPLAAQVMTTALRSFLHFLRQRGEFACDLAACVPAVASWRLQGIPSSLQPHEVHRLLASCDLRTAIGRRNRAVLLLLSRLGLRACEVVALALDDIDWIAGEVTVRGKGARRDRLPLPTDVGEALAAYARRDRPPCKTRRFFICARAPYGGFSGSGAVSRIVARALRRADLHPRRRGAHLLRHTATAQMLRRGASLRDIGEVLRHRRVKTTAIYAKIDLTSLRVLAPHWPRGAK
jgi:site-specific recombinase XerD